MRVLSLFSGVGGFDMGLEDAGMEVVAHVEFNDHCLEVLHRHWPDVPKWADVSNVSASQLPDCDVIAFGSPCQDLSVAGSRAGFVEGSRSNLFHQAIRIAKEYQDAGRGFKYIIWENVVGALSSAQGADFGAVLDNLADLGAVDIEWRVLDARWFGVPQRRRRVFVVARFDPRAVGRPEVLPVTHRGSGNLEEVEPKRQALARSLAPGSGAGGPRTTDLDGIGSYVVADSVGNQVPTPLGEMVPFRLQAFGQYIEDGTASNIQARDGKYCTDIVAYNLMPESGQGADLKVTQVNEAAGLNAGYSKSTDRGTFVAQGVSENQRGEVNLTDYTRQLSTGGGKPGQGYAAVLTDMPKLGVRRLTPRECERLMGWPDDHTKFDSEGKEIPQTHRYRMIGNGVASPVAEWIGRQIVQSETP